MERWLCKPRQVERVAANNLEAQIHEAQPQQFNYRDDNDVDGIAVRVADVTRIVLAGKASPNVLYMKSAGSAWQTYASQKYVSIRVWCAACGMHSHHRSDRQIKEWKKGTLLRTSVQHICTVNRQARQAW